MIRETDTIELSTLPGCSSIIRTKESITKVKDRLNRKKIVVSRKLAVQLNISRPSVCRILKNDLLLRPYKKIAEPVLNDEHKEKTKMYEDVFEKRGHDEDSVRHRWDLQLPK